MSVTVNNLVKKFGEQTAVDHVSFSLGKGEIVGFLGPNGAGKSTTMRMITGYLPADEGSIEVCGLPATPDAMEFRKKIGYLPESNPLYTEMYVKEYLQFVANVFNVKNARQTVLSVIERVGLRPESHKKIRQLSKGYKQRVGIAAAIVHNPEVLILDEPTSGLDPNQIIEIRNLIRDLAQDKTVLFSTHIMQEVEAICNRVIIINKGNLVADDQLQRLQKSEAENEVIVSFQNDPGLELLHTIDGVNSVRKEENNYLIVCTNAELVKKELLGMALKHNLDITSLHSRTKSLENIFRNLTASGS